MAASDNTCTVCECSVCSKIRLNIDQIFCALDIYGWMLDTYVVDFFQDSIWQKLPSAWRTFLDEITPEELGKWILKESESKKVWPLSMLAIRRFIESSEISRNHKEETILKCSVNSCDNDTPSSCANISNNESHKAFANDTRFNNLFSKHVKKKKRYEIDVMSKITADCANKARCDCIVDIGAGMGHLARVLAYKHDLCVACVEQNEALLEDARKWDEQLLASLVKHIPDFRERKPEHVSLQVGVTSAARQQLADQLTRIFANKFDDASAVGGFGLIGLHPCGDLAATLLRFYSSEDSARFICIVGCCYMKMTLGDSEEKGYPISRYLSRKSCNYSLTYAALEVACHALEKHCDKLKTNNYNDLIVHAYRAVLEFLLIEKNPELRHTQLKNTKIKEDTSFKEYSDAAIECLEWKDRPTNFDYERADIKQYLNEWKRVLIFVSLRMLIAPLVETIVLYDRFLYLSELCLSPSIKAEFDSRLSPRNFLLVSIKQRTEKNYK